MEDLSKLPKWAQQRIEQLEADKKYWQEKAMGATSPGLRDTNVVLVDTSHRGLPKDSRIRFTLPSGVIDVSHGGRQAPDGVLGIRSVSGDLIVHPASGNLIWAQVGGR